MDKNCNNCFYKRADVREKGVPCIGCLTSKGYGNWLSVDFLKDVPDDTSNVEGEKVMEQMLQQLDRIKSKEGVKYDSDKPRWSLLPFKALQEVVEVLTFGAKKYAADNWKHVPQAQERYIDAAYRHLADWNSGEKKDPETGKSHLAHAVCCLLFLLWFEQSERSGTP